MRSSFTFDRASYHVDFVWPQVSKPGNRAIAEHLLGKFAIVSLKVSWGLIYVYTIQRKVARNDLIGIFLICGIRL